MTVLLVILLAGVILATLASRREDRAPRPRAASQRPTSAAVSPLLLVGALVLGFVLLRFGMHWLVVAGGVLLAVLRSLLPLLRFLPLIQSVRRGAGPNASRGSGGASDAGAGSGGQLRPQRMTRQEALQVLGLGEGASPEDVQREYRRLIRKVHPDLGGSSYLAAKLNEAKDVLS